MYETGKNSWVGKLVRRGEDYGKVLTDWNWRTRRLTVAMDNGTAPVIELNNMGADDPAAHEWEWFEERKGVWYRF
jgi:hypothetical protein